MSKVENVLLIDDDDISNFLTATILKSNQAFGQIQISSDGQQALDLLRPASQSRDRYPDLILLDLNMPKLNGFNFLRSFRDLPGPNPKSRIIVLSTSNHQEDLEHLEQFPEVDLFINKPLTEESLQYILDRCFPAAR